MSTLGNELDNVCYNGVQWSFLEPIRDRNLTKRHITEVEMKTLARSKKAKGPENYLPESSAIMDLRDGFECILNICKNWICVTNLPRLVADTNVILRMNPLHNLMKQIKIGLLKYSLATFLIPHMR